MSLRDAAEPGAERPWYADGLRFRCLPDCAACCVNHGSYAYVYLEPEDELAIAGFLGLTRAEFRRHYTSLDDGHRVLRMDDPACPLLAGTRCSVYPVRPVQCGTFPFWQEKKRN